MLDLLDYYAAGWPYLFIGLCEFIIIAYIYGVQNYFDDLYHMTKLNPGMWGKSHLVFVYMTLSPLIITVSINNIYANIVVDILKIHWILSFA